MKNAKQLGLGATLALALGIAGAAVLRPAPKPPLRLPVTLPLEVCQKDAALQSARLLVLGNAAALHLQIQGLEKIGEGSVRVDLGPWIVLGAAPCVLDAKDAAYGGIGGNGTIGMTLPARLAPGTHTFAFRYDHSDGVSSEYRVLALAVQDARGKSLLAPSQFKQHDPVPETPPLTDALSIQMGHDLFYNGDLVSSPLVQTAQNVTCASCHYDDGSDLKHFGYTNNDIVKRCLFHGLSAEQGNQVASYIRTLPVKVSGRPWNPVFQPGPGLDAKAASDFDAGAGLAAVLPSDKAMLPYVFPNGITKVGYGAHDTLNLREIPIALQLLNWNQCLPREAPQEAFGDLFTNSGFSAFYKGDGPASAQDSHGNLSDNLANPDPAYHAWFTSSVDAPIVHHFAYWSKALQGTFMAEAQAGNDGTALYQDKLESAGKWRFVKELFLMSKYGLYGVAPSIYPDGGEVHSGLSGAAFDASPASTGVMDNGTLYSQTVYELRRSQWYQANAVFDSGNRHREGWYTLDYSYVIGTTGDLARATGQSQFVRITVLWLKAVQQTDTNETIDTTYGWFPHYADLRSAYYAEPSADLSAGQVAQIATVMAQVHLDKMQEFTPAQWRASAQWGPQVFVGGDSLKNMEQESLTDLLSIGVGADTLSQMRAFDQSVWPDF